MNSGAHSYKRNRKLNSNYIDVLVIGSGRYMRMKLHIERAEKCIRTVSIGHVTRRLDKEIYFDNVDDLIGKEFFLSRRLWRIDTVVAKKCRSNGRTHMTSSKTKRLKNGTIRGPRPPKGGKGAVANKHRSS